ncbi:hypothetical protein DAPPUDRAFT_334545 [Daphnia pulex]|uniref:Uncharacterized protein n=1 Tax=Daphnia pulex TaxID=6669 RepID=E9HVT5_DAPPU|nr:hypothetical protein DAPPUDRAFT_334540 [Daphnia pulex]EFX64140.1 hypothetical protein DAPPUDRAFT_334545 [Daphnia pulex]|eukprot:EFX64137.1 hypothetical protein DAPPUDRAFT_334540 [Daphnia pulex]
MGNRNSSSKYLDSSVLSKYVDKFAKLEKKTKRKKSSSNEEQPPPSSKWNCKFIMALTFVLSLVDLVEIRERSQISCERCKSKSHMKIEKDASKIYECYYLCHNKVVNEKTKKYEKCETKSSVRRNTWFWKSHLMIWEILLFTYYWWHKKPLQYIQRELECAHQTVVAWGNFCREVAIEVMLTKSERIGGPGKVVEIDES